MIYLDSIFAGFTNVAEPQPALYYLKLIAASIAFFVFWQAFFELATTRWIATSQKKPRDVQIEHRSYLVSLIHSPIVCTVSFYSMFYAW